MIPGRLAGLSLLVPVLYFSIREGWRGEVVPLEGGFWHTFREAIWGLVAPVIILGGLRFGLFTPTEAAVVAAFYGLFVGFFIYRTLDFSKLYRVLVESAEISAVVMIIIALASIYAHAGSTLGTFDAFAKLLLGFTANETVMLAMIMVMLLIAGMLLDAISIFLVFLPILVPIMRTFNWDPVWFGVLLTMNLAIGQFTPPMAVNLMVTSRIAGVTIESTARWVIWMVAAMLVALVAVAALPVLATWLPRRLGY
jgi:tripartite ATP-independent transporter DctM subunit